MGGLTVCVNVTMFIVMAKQITRRVGVDLAGREYDKFYLYCAKRGKKMTVVLRTHIRRLISKEEDNGNA